MRLIVDIKWPVQCALIHTRLRAHAMHTCTHTQTLALSLACCVSRHSMRVRGGLSVQQEE